MPLPTEAEYMALLDIKAAATALFDGGFIASGTREFHEWAQELRRRVDPLSEALDRYYAALEDEIREHRIANGPFGVGA